MSNVYFIALTENCPDKVSAAARKLLETLVEKENIQLSDNIPLKVHFGEKFNRTYIKSENYAGIRDFLAEKKITSCYIETSVLYGGERFERAKHLKLAAEHGFTQLPVVIADGERGEASCEIPVNKSHFKSCHIAGELAESDQVIVLSHFKGHSLAGFGGALKQLSMGFASKGGKLAMHMGVKPRIRTLLCKRCKACMKRCQVDAITIDGRPHIDHAKCLGCGACFSICPHHAISILSLKGIWEGLFKGKFFREKLAEYAYASSHGKNHIYINFALNITGGCDCEPRPMRCVAPNIGIFASTDPVAIDAACYDAVKKTGKAFKGYDILEYAQRIGVGSMQYQLHTEE
ncbi:MAG: DUF362 domain-containing protein [Lentisphaeria bacterium]|nr:DUF362 domain-containing protein [Lentisphaeria bacterium]